MDAHPFELVEHVLFGELLLIEREVNVLYIKEHGAYEEGIKQDVLSLYTQDHVYFGSITAPVKRQRKRIRMDVGEGNYTLHLDHTDHTISVKLLPDAIDIAGYINAVTTYHNTYRCDYWSIKIRSGNLPACYRVNFMAPVAQFDTPHKIAFSIAMTYLNEKNTPLRKLHKDELMDDLNVLNLYDTGVKRALFASLKSGDGEYLYIGRENNQLGLERSPLANPFPVGKHMTRKQAVKRYRRWLHNKILQENQEILRYLLFMPDDINLVCYCAPKTCHGHVIIKASTYIKRSHMVCYTCDISNYDIHNPQHNFNNRAGYIHIKDKPQCNPCYCDEMETHNYCDACLDGYKAHVDTGAWCVCTAFYSPCTFCESTYTEDEYCEG